MDTALAGGDFSLGANGLPRGISGEEESFSRISGTTVLSDSREGFPCR